LSSKDLPKSFKFFLNNVGLKNMYSNTFFCIKKINFVTTPIKNDKGVKQGDSLSPTLFKKNLNDLGKSFDDKDKSYPLDLGNHKINHLLFADDLEIIKFTFKREKGF
jgi:hypothetical protein